MSPSSKHGSEAADRLVIAISIRRLLGFAPRAAFSGYKEKIMAKRKESRYSPGRRSENRLKIKTRRQQEAIIGGVTGTKPPRSGYS